MKTNPQPLRDAYQLLVDCRNEEIQRALYQQLTAQGHRCRVLTRLGTSQKSHEAKSGPLSPEGKGLG